jgi:hypothetical protein
MKRAKCRSRHRSRCRVGEVVYLESGLDRRLSPSARRDFDDVLRRYGEVLRIMAAEIDDLPDNHSEPMKHVTPRS